MRFLLATIAKEVRRRINDPWGLLIWLAIPLVVGVLMGAVLGGGNPTVRAKLLIVDHDNSLFSQGLAAAFGQGELGEMIETTPVDENEGRALMEEGAASALLVIPEGLGTAYLNREPATLELVTNPAQRISPRLIRDALQAFLDAGNILHLVFEEEFAAIAVLGDDDDVTLGEAANVSSAVSSAIAERITALSPYLFPPLIEVADETPKPEGLPASFALLMFPGILVMALFFAAQGISNTYWAEKEQGTLARWLVSPNPFWQFWLGQFMAAIVLAGLLSLPLIFGGFWYLDLPWAKLPAALLWLMLAGPLLFAFLMLIQTFAPSRRAGNIITTLVMFPLLLMGGSFFPKETLPGWMAPVADLTPNGRIIAPLKQYLLGGIGVDGLAVALLPLLGVAAVLMALSALVAGRRLKR